MTPEEADGAFMRLCSWMRRCRPELMMEAALSLMRHKDKILDYFTDRPTNAICEGINPLVQTAKCKVRGYRTLQNFPAMIYLIAEKLKLDVPSPFGYRMP